MENNVLRHLFTGFVRLHILYHAAKEPICGVEIMEELRHHGYKIGPGTLYPVLHGLEQGGHKGYGLAVMVDILAGVLSGGGFSAQLAGGENMTWTMAVDIAAFRSVDEFKAMMDEMIQELHATPPEPGADRVMVAGDPEYDTEAERREQGIPLHTTQYEAIVATARRVGAPVLI